jgi:plasmid stabilization system protein ParE
MAEVVVARIFATAERLLDFPDSGRSVPEFPRADVREIIHRPYRIVYRLADADHIDILTVHHAARRFPDSL